MEKADIRKKSISVVLVISFTITPYRVMNYFTQWLKIQLNLS